MPRIRKFCMDGYEYNIAPFSVEDFETFLKDGEALRKSQPPPTQDVWVKRTRETAAYALNRANPNEGWNYEKVVKELDMVLVNKIVSDFMEMSGIVLRPEKESPADVGEVTATSTSA